MIPVKGRSLCEIFVSLNLEVGLGKRHSQHSLTNCKRKRVCVNQVKTSEAGPGA